MIDIEKPFVLIACTGSSSKNIYMTGADSLKLNPSAIFNNVEFQFDSEPAYAFPPVPASSSNSNLTDVAGFSIALQFSS